ncbi:hypothetical protein, partial [Saccharothrix sp. ST-888]|uniref:hypothetical protein n=1 Tax=Saccharothrix sp. ST-888 TaxID=1427391 RepID=UPI0012E00271
MSEELSDEGQRCKACRLFPDRLSLQCLLFLLHRLGTARTALVLADRTSAQDPNPAFHAERLRQPNCVRILLGPRSRQGVVQL